MTNTELGELVKAKVSEWDAKYPHVHQDNLWFLALDGDERDKCKDLIELAKRRPSGQYKTVAVTSIDADALGLEPESEWAWKAYDTLCDRVLLLMEELGRSGSWWVVAENPVLDEHSEVALWFY